MDMTTVDTAKAAIALRLNDKAPGFSARSTSGEVSLSDYRGRWVMFFSHPADFTSVCTSEFIALVKAPWVMLMTEASDFRLSARNCLAGTVESVSHGAVS